MKEKLYPFHVTLLIYMIQAGVVVFSLPRLMAIHLGYNGWVFLFLFLAITTLNIMLISKVVQLSKGRSIFQILEQALPKVILVPLYVFLLSVWTLIGCIAAKKYVIIYQVFVFPTAHPMLIKFIVDILALLLLIKGIYNISKAATVFFWLVIWSIFLLLYFIQDFQSVDLTPFLYHEASDTFSGSMKIMTAFLGYELAILLYPYAEKGKGFLRAIHSANLLTALTYILICLLCFGFYSLEQLKRMKYPVIELLAYIELPFVERIENLVFSIYIFTALIGIVMYSWAAIETAHRVLPQLKSHWLTVIIVTSAFVVSWIPDVLTEVEHWLKILGQLGISIAFALPMLLIIILLLQKKRSEPCTDFNEQ